MESQNSFSIEVVFIEEYQYATNELQVTRQLNGNRRQKKRTKKLQTLPAQVICLFNAKSDREKS